jgi:hypothetical protein
MDLKDSLLVAFMQKNLDSCWNLTLIPLSLHSRVVFTLFRQLSLVEYFRTQDLLNPVAGASHEQVCFGPCCMTVFAESDNE